MYWSIRFFFVSPGMLHKQMLELMSAEGLSTAVLSLQDNPAGLHCPRNRSLFVVSGVQSADNLHFRQVCSTATLASPSSDTRPPKCRGGSTVRRARRLRKVGLSKLWPACRMRLTVHVKPASERFE